MKALTGPQREFLAEWFKNGRNARAAYVKTHPHAVHWKPKSVDTMTVRWMKLPLIKKLVKEADDKAMAAMSKVTDRYAVTAERVTAELAKIAFANPTDVMEWGEDGVTVKASSELKPEEAAAIQEVTEIPVKDGPSIVRIKMAPKKEALDSLAKILGMHKEDDKTPNQTAIFVIEKGDGKGIEYAVEAAKQINGQK